MPVLTAISNWFESRLVNGNNCSKHEKQLNDLPGLLLKYLKSLVLILLHLICTGLSHISHIKNLFQSNIFLEQIVHILAVIVMGKRGGVGEIRLKGWG